MKKILLIILAVLLLAGCAPKQSDIEILNEVMNTIDLPLETKEDLELPSTYTYEEKIIKRAEKILLEQMRKYSAYF